MALYFTHLLLSLPSICLWSSWDGNTQIPATSLSQNHDFPHIFRTCCWVWFILQALPITVWPFSGALPSLHANWLGLPSLPPLFPISSTLGSQWYTEITCSLQIPSAPGLISGGKQQRGWGFCLVAFASHTQTSFQCTGDFYHCCRFCLLLCQRLPGVWVTVLPGPPRLAQPVYRPHDTSHGARAVLPRVKHRVQKARGAGSQGSSTSENLFKQELKTMASKGLQIQGFASGVVITQTVFESDCPQYLQLSTNHLYRPDDACSANGPGFLWGPVRYHRPQRGIN